MKFHYPLLALLHFLRPRGENPVWSLIMSEVRYNRRVMMSCVIIPALTLITVILAQAFRTPGRITFLQFGFVMGNVVAITNLGAELLRIPVSLPATLRKRDWADSICAAPIQSSAFVGAYARLALASGIVTLILAFIAIFASQTEPTANQFFLETLRLLSYVFICLYSYMFLGFWCGVAGRAYIALPFIIVILYAGSAYFDLRDRRAIYIDERWYHMTFAAAVFLLGLVVYYVCRKTYADRLRLRMFP